MLMMSFGSFHWILDQIEFAQHHVWVDLKPNQTEHIKYAGAHTICIQNKAASNIAVCHTHCVTESRSNNTNTNAHTHTHKTTCTHQVVKRQKQIKVDGNLLAAHCSSIVRRWHLLSLVPFVVCDLQFVNTMLFWKMFNSLGSCAHQTSLNCVCSGAATWTNSATVNQLVYHWIYTLWLIFKAHCYHHIVSLLFGWHISESFPLYK